MQVGTAGWTIPRGDAAAFTGEGQHLHRYAQVMGCTEINSSFYRSHRIELYQRWAALTPKDFRFSVKLPRTITHDAKLRRTREPLMRFLAEVAGLGERLGVLLVQLPPSLVFEVRPVRNFFDLLADQGAAAAVVVEARHTSWFTPAAERLLVAARVSRAAVDPALCPAAQQPGGWLGADGDNAGAVLYHRWHGSPRMYWSTYDSNWLQARADEVRQQGSPGSDHWCIFDNTAGGQALSNAIELQTLLAR
jgi:uncharacterized protein YecE (DUF72 family)